MYIYIEGKEPVARKSKSLAEMGVKDGDTLIVTTEMKLPFQEMSEDDDLDNVQDGLYPGHERQEGEFQNNEEMRAGNMGMGHNQMDMKHVNMPSPRGCYEIPPPHLQQQSKEMGHHVMNQQPNGNSL